MKNLKSYKLFCLALLLAFCFSSCNESFLDQINPNENTNERFWRDEKDVIAAMATPYRVLRHQHNGLFGGETGFAINNIRGEDVVIRYDDQSWWAISRFMNDPSTGVNNTFYEWMYIGIQNANVIIKKVDDVPMDEIKINAYKAEARFMRAFFYFYLVQNYEQVPLRTEYVSTAQEAIKGSSSAEDIWLLIEDDLKFAQGILPATRPEKELGRATSGAATGLLAKSYLFQNKFNEAAIESAKLINSGAYDLMPEYVDNFTPEKEFNKESIFEINYTPEGTLTQFYGDNWLAGGLPQYLGVGSPVGGWFKMTASGYLIKQYMSETPDPNLTDTKFDKRMYANLIFNNSDFEPGATDETWYGGRTLDNLWGTAESRLGSQGVWENEMFYPKDAEGKQIRFINKKWTSFWLSNNWPNDYDEVLFDSNYRIMRFAEILLIHAEAAAKTGDLSSATKDINRIRVRAGLTELPTFVSEQAAMKEIEKQNLLELYLESNRFYYLKHWYSYEELKQILAERNKQGANNFMAKHYVLPIPSSEINSNTAISQHPLW